MDKTFDTVVCQSVVRVATPVQSVDQCSAGVVPQVRVDLLDENDNAPVMESSEYTGTVRENQAELDNPVIVKVRGHTHTHTHTPHTHTHTTHTHTHTHTH